jgi:hypothetical protein
MAGIKKCWCVYRSQKSFDESLCVTPERYALFHNIILIDPLFEVGARVRQL